MTLQGKMTKGALWSIVEKGGQQFVSFFVFLVIARLVGPEEYGLAMLCFIYLSFSTLLLSGMADGIVALCIKDPERISSLFWFIMLVGAGLSLLCLAFSGVTAFLFGDPRLAPLLRWLSLVPVLVALTTVPNTIVLQNMDFKVYAIRALAASTGSGIVGMALAYKGFGAYAIIAQQIVLYILTNVILWAYVDWRPARIFSRSSLLETLKPGLYLMGSNVVSFGEEQIPRLIIGSVLGPAAIGFYAFACRMRFAIQDILIMPSFLTLYPALAEIKHDNARQKELVGQMVMIVGFLIFPALAIASLTAPLYVPLFFGEAWVSAVPLLQLFVLLGMVSPFVNIVRIICRTHNRVADFLRLQTALVALCALAVYVLAPQGLMAVAWGVCAVTAAGIPLYYYFLRRWLGFDLWASIAKTGSSLASTLIVAATVYAFMKASAIKDAWANLAAALVVGGSAYVAMALLLQRERVENLLRFVKETAGRKKAEVAAEESEP